MEYVNHPLCRNWSWILREVVDDRVIWDVGDSGLVNNEREDVITSCVLGGSKMGVTAMHEGRSKGVDRKGLCNLADGVGVKGPVLLEAHLHHEAVICKVGGVVTGLPDIHVHRLLPGAVVLKPS